MAKNITLKNSNQEDLYPITTTDNVVQGSSTLTDVLNNKFDKTGGTITGDVGINGSLNGSVVRFGDNVRMLASGSELQITAADGISINGVPIIESGSNTNGYWVRFVNGTQICWGMVDHGSYSYDWQESVTFPQPFLNAPKMVATPVANDNRGQMCHIFNLTNTGAQINQTSKPSANGRAQYVHYIAIGHWK